MEEDPFAKLDDPSDFHRDPDSLFFDRDRHICFLEMMYQLLPAPYQEQDINRLTLAYFVVSGLHILSAIDRIDRQVVIDWVLSLQAHPKIAGNLEKVLCLFILELRKILDLCFVQSYDGGFGLIPGSESHGGARYCVVASLQPMDFLEEGLLLSTNSSCHNVNVPLLLDWSLLGWRSSKDLRSR